jgi:hydroxymethylbilane synthase
MPLAAFTHGASGDNMQLNAAWGDPATAEASAAAGPLAPLVQVNQTAAVRNFAEAEALGEAVAAQLRAGGAVWAGKAPGV